MVETAITTVISSSYPAGSTIKVVMQLYDPLEQPGAGAIYGATLQILIDYTQVASAVTNLNGTAVALVKAPVGLGAHILSVRFGGGGGWDPSQQDYTIAITEAMPVLPLPWLFVAGLSIFGIAATIYLSRK